MSENIDRSFQASADKHVVRDCVENNTNPGLLEPRNLQGSVPFPVMLARQVSMKHFDPASGMATFSIEDLNVDDLNVNFASILTVFEMVRRILNSMRSNYGWFGSPEPFGFNNEIGIIGSSALLILEAIMRKSRIDQDLRGRWLREQTGLWHSNNVDLLLCGPWNDGQSFSTFTTLFDMMLSGSSRSLHHRVRHTSFHNDPHIFPNLLSQVMEVEFRGLDVKLRLIQASPADQVDCFICPPWRRHEVTTDPPDINITGVMYDPRTGLIHASLETVLSIETGQAEICDYVDMYPSSSDLSLLGDTLDRMVKYRRRGYTFEHFPRITCRPEENGPDGVGPGRKAAAKGGVE